MKDKVQNIKYKLTFTNYYLDNLLQIANITINFYTLNKANLPGLRTRVYTLYILLDRFYLISLKQHKK